MISKGAIKEVLNLTQASEGSFVILEKDEPKLVILDFNLYQSLVEKAKRNREAAPNLLEAVIKTDNEPETNIREGENVLLTGADTQLGQELAARLKNAGYAVSDYGRVSSSSLEDLRVLFEEEDFQAVLHLSEADGQTSSFSDPEIYFVENVDIPTRLLNLMSDFGVRKFLFRSSQFVSSPYGQTKSIFENILQFHHHSFGLNSISLRLPQLNAKPTETDFNNPSELLFENPLAAIMGTASNKISCLPVPYVEQSYGDGTPIASICTMADAANAFIFALQHLDTSTGAMVYSVPGFQSSISQLIEQVLERTGKMVTTQHVPEQGLWGDEIAPAKSLSEIGFQPQEQDGHFLIDQMKQYIPMYEKEKKAKAEEPISLSELLSGKFTPFIKPHNS